MTILLKTDAGREALSSTTRLLTPRERAMVLLADGQRTLEEVCGMVAGASPEALMRLCERGFLQIQPQEIERVKKRPRSLASTASADRAGPPSRSVEGEASGYDSVGPSTQPPVITLFAETELAPEPPASPEAMRHIRWARTPAATKLYLMDVVERTFARDDAQWGHLRELLREVRDEDSLAVAMDMVTAAMAAVAGEERAKTLREQLVL